MFLLNRRCMIYLLEFQASSLFRPFIVKILGGMTHKCIADSFFFFFGSRFTSFTSRKDANLV